MNILKWTLLTALAAAISAPFCRPVVAQGFVDVLDSPAQLSPLAQHGLLVGLASAGERLVAVGQRGHILFSDDHGQRWQQASVPVSSDLVAVHFPRPATAGRSAMTAWCCTAPMAAPIGSASSTGVRWAP